MEKQYENWGVSFYAWQVKNIKVIQVLRFCTVWLWGEAKTNELRVETNIDLSFEANMWIMP